MLPYIFLLLMSSKSLSHLCLCNCVLRKCCPNRNLFIYLLFLTVGRKVLFFFLIIREFTMLLIKWEAYYPSPYLKPLKSQQYTFIYATDIYWSVLCVRDSWMFREGEDNKAGGCSVLTGERENSRTGNWTQSAVGEEMVAGKAPLHLSMQNS